MKKLLSILLCLPLALFMPLFAGALTGGEIYVSPDGDDGAAGTEAAPLRTAAGAAERLRGSGADGARVIFSSGRYEFDSTLALGADFPKDVTFEAAPGAEVSFSGAHELRGFETETLGDMTVFTKTLGDGVVFRSLFDENGQLPVTRYPESGYFTVKKTAPEDDMWTPDNAPWSLTLGQRSFYADPADLSFDFRNPGDVQVRILHYWHDELSFLTGCDRTTGKISLSRPSTMVIRDIDRFFFENVFEALDAPGEWYLDTSENKLYYVPREGESPEDLTLYAPAVETLIAADGVTGLAFRGIRFTQTDWTLPAASDGSYFAQAGMDFPQAAIDVTGVVTVANSGGVSFSNCEFAELGATGVKLLGGVTDSSVENCVFRNVAATGVFAGGSNCLEGQEGYTARIRVANNLITGYGRKFFCAIGVQFTFVDGGEIANNEICDGWYTAISVGWNWGYSYNLTKNIKIRDNLIYNIGQGWLSDMGGIYTLGVQPGTELTGNVIHNVAADPGEGGYGGWGIYLDEGSSDMLVEKNLVYACGSEAFNIHYGENNVIRNNIAALSGDGQVSTGTRGGNTVQTAEYSGNIILTDAGSSCFTHMDKPGHFTDKGGNIFWDLTLGENVFCTTNNDRDGRMPLSKAVRRGFVKDPVVADPGFVDPRGFDFTFKEDPAALAEGFEAWDYDAAGTIAGTTVGLSTPGGQTKYNDNAEPTLTPDPDAEYCAYCGETHAGFLGAILAFFHRVLLFLRELFV